jgi:hypothetical protein
MANTLLQRMLRKQLSAQNLELRWKDASVESDWLTKARQEHGLMLMSIVPREDLLAWIRDQT